MGEPEFAAVNTYIYHSARSAFYGGVIWALGPVVDDSRSYGWPRVMLARATCTVVRRVIRADD